MKKVIRHGIFETNSSSSHSLTIKLTNNKEYIFEGDEVIEIREPFKKLIWLKCMLNHADADFCAYSERHIVFNEIKTALQLQGKNVDDKNLFEIFDVLCPLELEKLIDTSSYKYVYKELVARKEMLTLHSRLISEYAKKCEKNEDIIMQELEKHCCSDDCLACCSIFKVSRGFIDLEECCCGLETYSSLLAEFNEFGYSKNENSFINAFLSDELKVVGIKEKIM